MINPEIWHFTVSVCSVRHITGVVSPYRKGRSSMPDSNIRPIIITPDPVLTRTIICYTVIIFIPIPVGFSKSCGCPRSGSTKSITCYPGDAQRIKIIRRTELSSLPQIRQTKGDHLNSIIATTGDINISAQDSFHHSIQGIHR